LILNRYPKLIARPTPDARPSAVDQEAWKVEQESLANIFDLIQRCIEGISFLSILIDFRVSNVVKRLQNTEMTVLQQMKFEAFVVSQKGREIAKALMTALVNSQISKELGVESVIDSLQRRCPTICEGNDVILFQVRKC
jgi:nuclear pore complex protein Nup155